MVERLMKTITYTEIECLKIITNEINNDLQIISMLELAKTNHMPTSTFNNVVKMLVITGIIDVRSLGKKGTLLRITDPKSYIELVKLLNR